MPVPSLFRTLCTAALAACLISFPASADDSRLLRCRALPRDIDQLAPESPVRMPDGTVDLLGRNAEGDLVRVPVTVHDGKPLGHHSSLPGAGLQTRVDAEAFPTLAATGLHNPAELDAIESITGRTLSELDALARPDEASSAGFIAADETLIGVIREDNRRVRALGLRHPDLARPLFHVWNAALARHQGHPKLESAYYNGGEIRFDVLATRGYQESIFDDGIRGSHEIHIEREPTADELAFLKKRYDDPEDPEKLASLIRRLSVIDTGEMVAFYIQQYGFYEGHTGYRADPITIAFVFGLVPLEKLEATFPGRLDEALREHFVGR